MDSSRDWVAHDVSSAGFEGVVVGEDLDYNALDPQSFPPGVVGTLRVEDSTSFIITGRDLARTSIELPTDE